MGWTLFTKKKQDDADDKEESKDKFQFSSVVINWLSAGILIAGVIIVLIFGNSPSGKATILEWMLACLLAGVFIGFLFGIPKILQSGGQNPPPPPPPAPTPNAAQPGGGAPPTPPSPGNIAATVGFSYQQQVNTNLTEISDWLTKIIVGLGLVNLKQIPPYLRSTATILAQALDKPTGTKGTVDQLAMAFAYGTIVTYTILGFLFGYIATRIYLAGWFLDADRRSLAIDRAISTINTTKAAADSAVRKAEFAVANSSTPQDQTIVSLVNNPQTTPDQLLSLLIQSYNDTRQNMPSGRLRTDKMTAIMGQMVRYAPSVQPFDVATMIKDTDNGRRLAAYAWLYARPDYTYISTLVDALTSDPLPFNQYWAIQSLGKILALQPNSTPPPDVMKKLQTYFNGLQEGVDRKYELASILPVLRK